MKCVKKTVRHYWKYVSPASGYRQLQDITNSGTQRIDTGVDGYVTYGVEIDFTVNSIPAYTYPPIIETNRDDFCVGCYGSSGTGYVHIRYSEPIASIRLTNRNIIKIENSVIKHNGVQVATYYPGALAAEPYQIPVYVFGNAQGAAYTNTTVRYLKFFNNNGDLTANFIPCERISDGVKGLYDTVNNTFKTNIGTGTFTTSGYVIEAGTSSDYDYYTDDEVAFLPSITTRHYWKYKTLYSGYREVESITNTGSQYINTGLTLNQNSAIEITYRINSFSGFTGVMGSRSAASSNNISVGAGDTLQINVDFNNSDYNTYRAGYNDVSSFFTKKITAYSDKNIRKATIDGTIIVQNTTLCGDTITTPTNCCIFKVDNAGGGVCSLMTAYSAKIWNDSTLVRDFVPCRRTSDSVFGVFDKKNNVFYPSSSSESFTGGDDVVIEGTSSDYDFYTDDTVYYGINQ